MPQTLTALEEDLIEILRDAEFLMRKAAQVSGPMQDSFKRCAEDARSVIRTATLEK